MSLSESEYVEQEKSIACRVHLHDGVWWKRTAPFHFKPAYEFKRVVPGSARPAWLRGGLTYSHVVLESATANRTLTYYAITRPRLSQYNLGMLSAKRRNCVKRGNSRCESRLLETEEIDRYVEDIREIVVSQAAHQQSDGFGLPPEFYAVHFEDWWRKEGSLYKMPGRDLWGAFASGKLVAYCHILHVEEVANFVTVKANSAYKALCPVDALYHTVICALRDNPRCTMIVSGGPSKASLASFKEQYQFRLTDIPIYTRGARPHGLAIRLVDTATAARQRFAKWKASSPDVGPEPPDASW
jgi:hypothetical protein